MFREFQGKSPVIHPHAFVAEGCQIIGNVIMKEYSSIWFNSVARADLNSITIGGYTNVQDGSVIHVETTIPTVIGDFCVVGHKSMIHGAFIEDHVLIGMGAILLNGCRIGRGSIIAAGAVVKENAVIPPFSLVAGVPGKIIKHLPEDVRYIHNEAVKYKTQWTERYGILPDAGGERAPIE
ncbi:MAG: gamma carbonic anhydrase family protein [Peptostreptococcaceae bacterium]|nr:gamma carbonic anhydrase family protein [Peptostreptococcaceae bacterium]